MKHTVDILLACIIILLAIIVAFMWSINSKTHKLEAQLHIIDYNVNKTYNLISPYIDYQP